MCIRDSLNTARREPRQPSLSLPEASAERTPFPAWCDFSHGRSCSSPCNVRLDPGGVLERHGKPNLHQLLQRHRKPIARFALAHHQGRTTDSVGHRSPPPNLRRQDERRFPGKFRGRGRASGTGRFKPAGVRTGGAVGIGLATASMRLPVQCSGGTAAAHEVRAAHFQDGSRHSGRRAATTALKSRTARCIGGERSA